MRYKNCIIFLFRLCRLSMNNNINSLAFGSGLNTKIKVKEKFIFPQNIENVLANKYGVEANFIQNKAVALANKFCVQIFEKLADILKQELILPPCITAFDRICLIDKKSASNFCIPDTKEVIKGEYPYPGRSVFFQRIKNLSEIDDITEYQYKNKRTSSSHFLSPFIHEWLHSFHLDAIYNKFGYGGSCEYLINRYPFKNTKITGIDVIKQLQTKKLTPNENEIIFDTLGEYSTNPENQYLEIFSETFTKFICASLNGIELVKNPIELLKNTPREFQKILKKIIFPTF